MKIRFSSNAPISSQLQRYSIGCLFSLMLFAAATLARGTGGYVGTQFSPGDFRIVFAAYVADIYVDSQETPAVLRC
jgi:hypothetical protein